MRRRAKYDRKAYYRGIRMVPYDLVKELAVAMVVTTVLVIGIAAIFSSPDVPVLTVQTWSRADPVDFVTTSTNALAGTTTSAQYGPPYNNGTNSVQHLWFLHPQEWAGVHQPIDPPNDFVLRPLQQSTVGDKQLSDALNTYQSATSDQQNTWLTNYTTALGNANVDDSGNVTVATGDYGPLPVMMGTLLGLARSGGLDGLLLQSDKFYQTDYTRPLLFLADGGQIAALAQQQSLTGNQWGVMNETGRYPGQAWLWLYTMWYQVAPFNQEDGFLGVSTANADLAVVFVMGVLTLALLFLPFIPGLRDIPRWIPVYRLIWRRYYAEEARAVRM
jgi:hypothetical protein